MKNTKEVYEQNILFEIKGNNTLNTRNNYLVGRTTINTYSLDEDKGLQE